MNFIKKLFVSALLFVFMLSSTGIVNATDVENTYKQYLIKEIIIKKQKLSQIKSGDKIRKKIDLIVEKLKNNKEKLEEVQAKIWKLKDKYYKIKDNSKGKKIFAILTYFDAKINLALYEIRQKEVQKAQELRKKQEEQANKKIEDMLSGNNISEADKKKVEEKLLKIQLNLLDNFENKIQNLTKEFEKYTSYEEKGTFKLNMSIDADAIGKIKAALEAKNYSYKANVFDAQFSSKLKGLLDVQAKGEKNLKLEFDSFIDYIQKDGDIYVLLKDLNIINDSEEKEIKDFIKKAKKFASKNKYIKIEDRQTKEILKNLKNINISKIKGDLEKFLSNPLLTAYKKEGNKYYLIPTKYACNKYKELMYNFDPWNGKTCSDSQYEKMLEELAKSGDLYIELGAENKLVFKAYPSYDILSFNNELVFSDTEVKSFHSELQAKNNEGFELSYIKNKKLAFYFNADKTKIDFKSTLNSKNKFELIDFVASSKGYNDELSAKLKLQNKKITGGFTYTGKEYAGYDEKTWESIYIPVKYFATISGTQDYNYNLKDLKIDYKQVNSKTNKAYFTLNLAKQSNNYKFAIDSTSLRTGNKQFNTNIKLNNKTISGKTTIFENNKESIIITHSGKYDDKYLQLNNKIKLAKSLSAILYQGYIEGAKNSKVVSDVRQLVTAIEMGLVKGSFELKDIVKDGNKINYELLGIDEKYFKQPDGKEYLIFINKDKYQVYGTVQENGKIIAIIRGTYYVEQKGNPQSLVKINGKIINDGDIVGTYKQEKEKSADGNVNFEIDTRYNRDNIIIHIDYSEDNKKMFEYDIENRATIDYNKKPEIKAPKDYIEENLTNIKY